VWNPPGQSPGKCDWDRNFRLTQTEREPRGKCIQKFGPQVVAAQWDHITLQGSDGLIKISLLDLFGPETILYYGNVIAAASSPDDLRILDERGKLDGGFDD